MVPNSQINETFMCNREISLPKIMTDHLKKIPDFCNLENIEECMVYISHELNLLGYPSITSEDNCKIDEIKLINVLWELLQCHIRSIKVKEELEKRNIRTSCDLDIAYASQSRLKESLQQKEYSIAAIQENIRQLTNKLKHVQSQLKTERDEKKRLLGIIQQKYVQYHHEIRKKEQEISILKERLHQAFMDKNAEKRFGMDTINGLSRSGGQRGKWKTRTANSHNEEELHKSVILTYENHQQELIKENIQLRDCFTLLQDELTSICQEKKQFREVDTNNIKEDNESNPVSSNLQSNYFQMPYVCFQKKLEDQLHTKCKYIKNYIKNLEEHLGHQGMKESKYKNNIKENSDSNVLECQKES